MIAPRDARIRRVGGLAAAGVLVIFLSAPFVSLPLLIDNPAGLPSLVNDPYLRQILAFTLWQAGLSTLLSIGLALPFALALHRATFPGRAFVLRLLLLPQALPTIVAALGLLVLFGRSGLLSQLSAAAGLGRLDIYGLPGILLAHVFFNLPLAARLMLAHLLSVPAESWKLAGQLGLSQRAVFRIVEWPVLRRAIVEAATLVFMLCLTSFTLVLILGGGPGATTIEVAIYQALRYDFDPPRALALSLLQIGLVVLILLPLAVRGRDVAPQIASLGSPAQRFDGLTRGGRLVGFTIVCSGLAFLSAPLVAIVWRGLGADLSGLLAEPGVRGAIATSAAIALASSTLALALSLALAFGATAARGAAGAVLSTVASLVLVVPPVLVGAGWFLVLMATTGPSRMAPVAIVIATNAIMAVPFMVRILIPAIEAAAARFDRLAASLSLSGFARLVHVDGPALRAPIALALATAMALSLGDLGAIALFGSQDLTTLPYLLLQRMGSYRTNDADGLALILALSCLVLMFGAERAVGGAARHGT